MFCEKTWPWDSKDFDQICPQNICHAQEHCNVSDCVKAVMQKDSWTYRYKDGMINLIR
jgi:hypothetical protein